MHIFELTHLLYKRADDAVFDDFQKISDHFPKIAEDDRRRSEMFRSHTIKFKCS